MLPPNGQSSIHDATVMSRKLPLLKNLVTLNIRPITVRERMLSHALLFLEDIIKVPLFRCQRCGECILSSTAFICSQNCPKRLRNGPCGGTGENGSCEVFPDRKCVWYRIYLPVKTVASRQPALQDKQHPQLESGKNIGVAESVHATHPGVNSVPSQ